MEMTTAMTTTTMTTMTGADSAARVERHGGKRGAWMWAAVGGVLGALLVMPWLAPDANVVMLSAAEQPRVVEGGDYTYFTFRRNLWVVKKSTWEVRFYLFPESMEQSITESRSYAIDAKQFPQEQTIIQVSERNLTNYLWLLNPTMGKARYIKARRDGGFDESALLEHGKNF